MTTVTINGKTHNFSGGSVLIDGNGVFVDGQRVDVDGFAEAKTTYGIIGIKVWVYKGEIFDFSQVGQEKQDDSPRGNDRGDRERPRGPRRERADRGEARE